MPETLDDLRRTNLAIADAIADGWERRRPIIEDIAGPVRAWLVEALAPSPGDTLLELAAGAGDTGFAAAARTGDDGRLITTDLSAAMLGAARRRGDELAASGVEYRQMDAERLALEADSVDGVLCRFGYMLMPDPAAALAETRRVLRPGGRLALAVWGAPGDNPMLAGAVRALVAGGHVAPPDPEGPGVFSLGDEDRLRALLAGAGFASVRVERIGVRAGFRGIGAYLDFTADTAGPIAIALRALTDEGRASLAADLEQIFAPFATDAGYVLKGSALAAVAS